MGRLEIKGHVYYSRRNFSRRGCRGKSDVFLKDVVVRPEDRITEMRTDTVMCVLNFDTMELKELRREKGVFSIQFLGGTKDYRSIQYKKIMESNAISLTMMKRSQKKSL